MTTEPVDLTEVLKIDRVPGGGVVIDGQANRGAVIQVSFSGGAGATSEIIDVTDQLSEQENRQIKVIQISVRLDEEEYDYEQLESSLARVLKVGYNESYAEEFLLGCIDSREANGNSLRNLLCHKVDDKYKEGFGFLPDKFKLDDPNQIKLPD